jgi:hypothetical protein
MSVKPWSEVSKKVRRQLWKEFNAAAKALDRALLKHSRGAPAAFDLWAARTYAFFAFVGPVKASRKRRSVKARK